MLNTANTTSRWSLENIVVDAINPHLQEVFDPYESI